MLPKNWTGDLVGLMHVHKISKKQLADHIGVTREYVSLVLNGHREPKGAEEQFKTAVNEIISNASSSSRKVNLNGTSLGGGETMKNYLFPRGCDSARVIPVIETRSARGSGAVDQPTRVVVEYWSLAGEKLAERDTYLQGMASASSKASSDST